VSNPIIENDWSVSIANHANNFVSFKLTIGNMYLIVIYVISLLWKLFLIKASCDILVFATRT